MSTLSWFTAHGTGSAWNEVIKQLEAKRTSSVCSHDRRSWQGVNKNVNHAQCTQSIVDYIVDKDLSDIVLLGHRLRGLLRKLPKRSAIALTTHLLRCFCPQ